MIEIDSSERIIRVVRKHWFVLIGDVFFMLGCIILPFIVAYLYLYADIGRYIELTGEGTYAAAATFFAWLIVAWMLSFNLWTDYYLDVMIVTDKRIFNINQRGLFRRESGSFRIDRIQNVTVDQEGIIETLLDFGTLRLETAGEGEEFIAPYIARPYEIKKFINECQDEAADNEQRMNVSDETLERIAERIARPREASPEKP